MKKRPLTMFMVLTVLFVSMLSGCDDQAQNPEANNATPPKAEAAPTASFADKYGLIPMPHMIDTGDGEFQITSITRFIANSTEAAEVADLFAHFLKPVTHTEYQVEQQSEPVVGAINFVINDTVSSEEGYRLSITSDQILIEASTPAGLFYGTQTIRQLLPAVIEQRTPINNVAWKVPAVTIEDAPVFGYRGMHLDVARHFFDKKFVKKYIDYIALHKMNVFHWHLTEDQGWRIEIKKYPKLTEIGSKRSGTVVGHAGSRPTLNDDVAYDGYYTQEDIKEIVAYAQRRHVEIIPEIDIPGHSTALLSAYPEYSCHGEQVDVSFRFGIFYDVLCPTPETFSMLKDIFTEIAALFPSKYIHIGGDEVRKNQWLENETVKALAKKEGLKDMHDVQSYFIRKVEEDINALGKQIIGWDEILEGGIAPNATIMSWRGEQGGIDAAKMGHDVIMTPNTFMYFDYYNTRGDHESTRIGGFLPIEKVYSYNPYPSSLTAEQKQHILGVQANVWSEYMLENSDVEEMILPRMSALSEVVWNPAARQWDSFLSRLPRHFERFDAMGSNASRGVYVVDGETTKNDDGSVSVMLSSHGKDHEIRYSLDGSSPKSSKYVYTDKLTLKGDFFLRATAFDPILQKHYGDYRTEHISHLAIGKKVTNNHLAGKPTAVRNEQGELENKIADGIISATATDGTIGVNNRGAHGEWTSVATSNAGDGRANMSSGMSLNTSDDGSVGSLDITVDLEQVYDISEVSYGFNPSMSKYSHRLANMIVQVSLDEVTWQEVKSLSEAEFSSFTNLATAKFSSKKARYVRIKSAVQKGVGAANARVYLDEVIIH